MEVHMSSNVKRLNRREFLQKAAAAGAVMSLSPLARLSHAQSPSRNRVTVAHGVGVYSLNPYAVTTSPIQGAWGSVMEALIDADYDKRGYRGLLAESWEMKGNKLQFKLRKGVRFHDGTSFTSKDVVASYKRILNDKQSLMAPSLQNTKEMETPDDLTMILTLKKVDATALEDLNNRPIMKQAAAEKMGEADNPPIGTGPFKFVSWDRSGQFVIRRNENYWGRRLKSTKSSIRSSRKTPRVSQRWRPARRI
jgi:ABC-type transport system substrate-binding protein